MVWHRPPTRKAAPRPGVDTVSRLQARIARTAQLEGRLLTPTELGVYQVLERTKARMEASDRVMRRAEALRIGRAIAGKLRRR